MKAALLRVSPELFNFFFLGIAVLISALPLTTKHGRREILGTDRRAFFVLIILAVIFSAAIYCSSVAMQLIQPATMAFLSRIEVLFTLVLAHAILRERLRFFEMVGGAVAVSGVLILKFKTTIEVSYAASLMIASSLLFAVGEVLLKKNIKLLGTVRFLFWRNLFLVGLFYLMLIARGQSFAIPDRETLLLIGAAALLLPILGRFTYVAALHQMNISRVALFTQSIPLFTALFAFAILTTLPSATEWLGGGLILAGVLLVRLDGKPAGV
jgi:drug/metabolite transporter (DMT)-like permease